jgi:DNA-directed RNA polymerase subunit H (RpoH/RPB5)
MLHFVSTPKARALRFLNAMFERRGYRLATKVVAFNKAKTASQVFIEDGDGQLVMCLLSSVCDQNNPDAAGVEQMELDLTDIEEEMVFHAPKIGPNKSNNIGTDFVKALVSFAENVQMSQVILVGDVITNYAARAIAKSNIPITCYQYLEASTVDMGRHVSQPLTYRLVAQDEQAMIQRKHLALHDVSVEDPMTKFLGFRVGDIIKIEDSDRHSGIVVKYGKVKKMRLHF